MGHLLNQSQFWKPGFGQYTPDRLCWYRLLSHSPAGYAIILPTVSAALSPVEACIDRLTRHRLSGVEKGGDVQGAGVYCTGCSGGRRGVESGPRPSSGVKRMKAIRM